MKWDVIMVNNEQRRRGFLGFMGFRYFDTGNFLYLSLFSFFLFLLFFITPIGKRLKKNNG